jgi:hypothetical protein
VIWAGKLTESVIVTKDVAESLSVKHRCIDEQGARDFYPDIHQDTTFL